MWAKYNLNEYIKFKTNDIGRDVWMKYYTDFDINFTLPDADEDGYYKMQLWTFMRIFGQEMHNGMHQVIETNILLQENKIGRE